MNAVELTPIERLGVCIYAVATAYATGYLMHTGQFKLLAVDPQEVTEDPKGRLEAGEERCIRTLVYRGLPMAIALMHYRVQSPDVR